MRGINRLSDVVCTRARPGKYGDGAGLHLLVTLKGVRYWRLKYHFKGKEKLAGLGRYHPDGAAGGVTIVAARKLRDEYLIDLQQGVDPIEKRRQEKQAEDEAEAANAPEVLRERTLAGFVDTYHAEIIPEFKNAKHAAQWKSSLAPVLEALGDRDLGAITKGDLIAAIKPIMARAPETGRRVRQRIMTLFSAATARDLIAVNPAQSLGSKDVLRQLGGVKPKGAPTPHLAALPFAQVPAFVVALREYGERLRQSGDSLAARYALEFALLTASRTSEVLGMTWDELSPEGDVWTIDAKRMKAGAAHVVYLSVPAGAILRTMKEATGGKGYVFPSARRGVRPLSNMVMTMILRRLKTGGTRDDGTPQTYSDLTTIHGLARASFSTWSYQNGIARGDVIECALAHREQDRVKAAYSRTDPKSFEAERRALMEAWGRYVSPATADNVVDLNARRSA